MLPTHAGQRMPSAATNTAVALLDGLLGSPSVVTADSSLEPTPSTVQPADGASAVPTYAVAMVHSGDAPDGAPPSVAVAIGDGALIVTTAAAVEGHEQVAIVTADGAIDSARVLLVDQDRGLAVLIAAHEVTLDGIAVADSISVGDTLTIPGHDVEPIVLTSEPSDDGWLPAPADSDVEEGHPVINQRGELVGLYTRLDDRPMVLMLKGIDELRHAIGAIVRPTVWLGVLIEDRLDGRLTITSVDADGPAALAGIAPGERLVAVGDTVVSTMLELAGALAVHHSGEEVELLLEGADGTTRRVTVVLATPPARL